MASKLKGDRISVPTGSSNPGSDSVGDMYFNTADGSLNISEGGGKFGKVVFAPKGAQNNPANSPEEIIVAGDDDGDGVYYYLLNGTATPIWTNFTYNDPTHGRGWLLAGRTTSGTTFNILSTNWSNVTQFGDTTSYTTVDNMKNNAWNYYDHNVIAIQCQQTDPNSSNNWFNFTHNKNITMNAIFSWDNVNNGFLTFNEQFDTGGSYDSNLSSYLDKIGYTGSRPGSPYGRLGLNAFMSTGPSGTRLNANQISSGQTSRSGVRLGYLGDGSSGGPVWPGQNGGPDDYGIGVAVQTCYDAGSCNVIVSSTYPGHYRLNSAYNGDTGSWNTRTNIWIK